MSVEEVLKYIIKINSKLLHSCGVTQNSEESQTYKTGLHIRGTKRDRSDATILKKALQGSWSRKLEANCLSSTSTVNKKVISLHIDKFVIMVWATKVFRKEVTPAKFMKVFKG